MFVYAFNVLTVKVWRREGHLACEETVCWYDGGGDLTEAFFAHLIEFQLSPLPPSSLDLGVAKSTSLIFRLFCKVAVKTLLSICRSVLKPIFVTPALRSASHRGLPLRSRSSVFWNVCSPLRSRSPRFLPAQRVPAYVRCRLLSANDFWK